MTNLIPLRVACGIGVADSVVALATALIARPQTASVVVGVGWVVAWSVALAAVGPLARAVGARPWLLPPVAALAVAPALLDGGYPGNLATQPMWIALVAAAAASWPVTVATGCALCAAKIAVFLATGTALDVLIPGAAPATEAITAAYAPLAVALLGLVLVHGLRRILAVLEGAEPGAAEGVVPAAGEVMPAAGEAMPAAGEVVPAPVLVPAAVGVEATSGAAVRLVALSPAERAVVRLLAEGLTPKQIAQARGTSLETVRTQIKRAKRSTQARTLDELVATAWRPD